MAGKSYDEDYDYEYEEEDYSEGGRSRTVFLMILGGLLLALTILCFALTGKLRSANKEVVKLRSELEAAKSVQWEAPADSFDPSVPSETVSIPVPGESTVAIPSAAPESTPAPTPSATPAPTPTPAAVVSAGSLPSWLTEANMAKVTRRPKDDEWYGAPGKLYVTATLGLNLRSGLRTDIDNILCQIKCGSEVEVYAASGNMRFVQDPKGNFGWCSNNLLSNEPPKGVTIIPFSTAPVHTPTPVSTPAPVSEVPVPEAPTING